MKYSTTRERTLKSINLSKVSPVDFVEKKLNRRKAIPRFFCTSVTSKYFKSIFLGCNLCVMGHMKHNFLSEFAVFSGVKV